jgi:rod shape-determining protein MreC
VAVIVAAIVGLALLLSDRRQTLQTETYAATRNAVDTVSAPVSKVVAAPVRWSGSLVDYLRDYMIVADQNRALREQVLNLDQARDKAIALENENRRLRSLLGLKLDPPIPTIAAQVIADAHGPFAITRLTNAGREKGVSEGNPVINEQGMIGRILGVGHGVSRVLMLTDATSRTPVLVDRTNARAILTGDGGPNPKLAYMRGVDPVRVGDRVLTSGDGGMFPRGLPVGVVVKGLDGSWRVHLASDDGAVDYVTILLFKDFSQLADLKELNTLAVPPLASAQAAQIAAQSKSTTPSQPPPASSAPAVKTASVKPALAKRKAASPAAETSRDAAPAPAPAPAPANPAPSASGTAP